MIKEYLLSKREYYKNKTEGNLKRLQELDKSLRSGGDYYEYDIDLLRKVQNLHKKNSKKAKMYSKICEILRLEIVELQYEAWFEKKTITIKGTSEDDIEKRVSKLKKKKWINLRKLGDDE